MSERRSLCASSESRWNRRGAGGWAACCAWLCLCACSGATDVVGVIDPAVTDVESAPGSTGATADTAGVAGFGQNGADGSALLIVAGLQLHDYPGPTFEWPLGLRLRVFFAEPSWGRSGPPDHVEREAFERMGPLYSERRKDEVRFVASSGDTAERLRALFLDASLLSGTEPRSLVTRDAWSDEYLVVLGRASCERTANHHGVPCADPSFTDANSNEGNADGANASGPGSSSPASSGPGFDEASFDAP